MSLVIISLIATQAQARHHQPGIQGMCADTAKFVVAATQKGLSWEQTAAIMVEVRRRNALATDPPVLIAINASIDLITKNSFYSYKGLPADTILQLTNKDCVQRLEDLYDNEKRR